MIQWKLWNWWMALLTLLLSTHAAHGNGDKHLCGHALGMESGFIPDSALKASSYYVHSVGPHQSRLNKEGNGGAWCPKEPISVGVREWIEVSFNGTHFLTAVQIQGRFARGKGQEYAEEFELEYWRTGFNEWRKYFKFDGKTVLPGNSDTSSVVTVRLRPPLVASKVRILPYSTHRRTVCLRIELLGCEWTDGVVEYRIPQGSTFVEGFPLRDDSYDGTGGKWNRTVDPTSSVTDFSSTDVEIVHGDQTKESEELNRILTGGLGLLTDKIEGGTQFTMDLGFGLGNGWVGWKCKQENPKSEFIELVFVFDKIRQFSSLDLYMNNFPSKGVQIPSLVKVSISVSDLQFNRRSLTYVPGPGVDLALEHSRNVSVLLDRHVGRFVRIQLYFTDAWILLGEIYFHSDVFDGNFTEEAYLNSSIEFPESQSPLEIRELDTSMLETVVGILCGLLLLASICGGVVFWMRRKAGEFPPSLHFQPGGEISFWRGGRWNFGPMHIVAQEDGTTTEGVKDLLLTLSPSTNGAVTRTNGDQNFHPPQYVKATPLHKSHENGLLQGHDKSKYGATGGENGSCRTNLTLRSNPVDREGEIEGEAEDESGILYQGTSPFPLQPTTTSTRTKNRKIKFGSLVWNLSSGGRSLERNLPIRLVPEVSLRQLRLIENLGSCNFGQVQLYDFDGEIACQERRLYGNRRLIAKTIKSMAEIRFLNILDHEHVLDLVGVTPGGSTPRLALFPAPECGDLCSFLSSLTNTPSLTWLVNVGWQIASGMNYLESLSLIHRDLAARNCLVEREGAIKISDLAMACEQYRGDYCEGPNGLAPLRWWPWETLVSEELSMKGSVWSFGVTLWEILTLCRQKPLAHIPDHQLLTLAEKYGTSATSQQVWLPQPVLSPPEIFDLMRECWQRDPAARPTFQHMYLFLEQKAGNSIYYHAV